VVVVLLGFAMIALVSFQIASSIAGMGIRSRS